MRRLRGAFVFGSTLAAALAGCSSSETLREAEPSYRDDIAPMMQAKCVRCHDGSTAQGGWRANTYMDVIGCGVSGGAAVDPGHPETSQIVKILDDKTHLGSMKVVDRLSWDQRKLLERWVQNGAPAFRGSVHKPGIVDPRSPDHHSKFLRDRQWAPMLDGNYQADPNNVDDPGACGQCHAGAPATPDKITSAAPGATACTSCHNQAGGVLGCTTCHGSGTKPYAVRDVCFHGPDARQQIIEANHDGHLTMGSKFMSSPLQCVDCHKLPDPGDVLSGLHGGTHANGKIDVFMSGIAGAQSTVTYDETTKDFSCSNRCHTGPDGARTKPSFTQADKIKCGDCHGVPPTAPAAAGAGTKHYQAPSGSCSYCHKSVQIDPTNGPTLVQPATFHMDWKVEIGDGSGKCNGCHGNTGTDPADPMPHTGAHDAHRSPKLRKDSIPCTTCHVVPDASSKHPLGDTGHGHVVLSGFAKLGGHAPKYDPTDKSCSDTYCHAAVPGGTNQSPKWDGGAKEAACGTCHSTPPPNHFTETKCGLGFCHTGIVNPVLSPTDPVVLTNAGIVVHIDGKVDPTLP